MTQHYFSIRESKEYFELLMFDNENYDINAKIDVSNLPTKEELQKYIVHYINGQSVKMQ